MDNLRKFETEAEYNEATLNYPSVSWIVSGDTFHFDKTEPVEAEYITVAFETSADDQGKDIVIYNGCSIDISEADYFTSVTLNNTDIMQDVITGSVLYGAAEANTTYLIKYGISGTTLIDYFGCDLGVSYNGEAQGEVEFLVPSFVTHVSFLPSNITKLVVMAATPPIFDMIECGLSFGVYVPDESLSVYQSAWQGLADIYPLSEYQGNLPV